MPVNYNSLQWGGTSWTPLDILVGGVLVIVHSHI
jgi:hypothetical protein